MVHPERESIFFLEQRNPLNLLLVLILHAQIVVIFGI